MAQGGFGPALAGTDLTFDEVQRQVRTPRDRMPAFDRAEVSHQDLRDIHAWLTSLPVSTPTPAVRLPPSEATAAARDRFYPAFDASDMLVQMDDLDEVALRIGGTVAAIEQRERFTEVSLVMTQGQTSLTVRALYDTRLARQSFPAAVGDQVTLYGVGANPIEEEGADGAVQKTPLIQILDVVVHE